MHALCAHVGVSLLAQRVADAPRTRVPHAHLRCAPAPMMPELRFLCADLAQNSLHGRCVFGFLAILMLIFETLVLFSLALVRRDPTLNSLLPLGRRTEQHAIAKPVMPAVWHISQPGPCVRLLASMEKQPAEHAIATQNGVEMSSHSIRAFFANPKNSAIREF